jgi:peptide/nickel transport system permease protein
MGYALGGILMRRMLAVVLVFTASFLVSRILPGDPVRLYLPSETLRGSGSMSDELYGKVAKRYHLDKPLFYFSIMPLSGLSGSRMADPMWLNREQRRFLTLYEWPESREYLLAVRDNMRQSPENPVWRKQWLHPDPEILPVGEAAQLPFGMPDRVAVWKTLLPVPVWHGMDNQYHRSMAALLAGDWGTSIKSGEPVSQRLKRSLGYTLAVNVPALVIAVFLSLVLGIFLAKNEDAIWARVLEIALPLGFVVPVFLLAILLLQLVNALGWYSGSWDFYGINGFGSLAGQYLQAVWMPVLCLVLPALGLLSRQVRLVFQAEMSKPYAVYLWLRGVPVRIVFWKYLLRNALVPLSADIGRVITSLIAGSLLVEIVFNIPGMGRLLYEAIWSRDWPVLSGVLFLSALMAVAGLLLSDIVLALVTRNKQRTV